MHQPVSSLNIAKETIRELNKAGYYYVEDLKEKYKAQNIPKTLTAFDLYEEESIQGSIWTFLEELDMILGGGVALQQIIEFCGERSTGKSLVCYLLCASVQLPTWCKGMEGEAVYICTNRRFASQRLKEIAMFCVHKYESMKMSLSGSKTSSNYTVTSIMRNIHCLNVHSPAHLMAAVRYLNTFLETHRKVRVVVVDSIVAPIRIVPGTERNRILFDVLRTLQLLSYRYNFAVVLTNDMTTGAISLNTYAQVPSLGGSYHHRINTRVHLSKWQGRVKARVTKSPSDPPKDAIFHLPC